MFLAGLRYLGSEHRNALWKEQQSIRDRDRSSKDQSCAKTITYAGRTFNGIVGETRNIFQKMKEESGYQDMTEIATGDTERDRRRMDEIELL
jgi:hypothetical protein